METFEWINNDRCVEKIKAMPGPQTAFRFAVFGDIQKGSAQFPRLLKNMESEHSAAFIIQTGDAVAHADPGHYKALLDALDRGGLRQPMFFVPGNHDLRDGDDELFKRYFGSRQMWFKYGDALFVLLDNSIRPFTQKQYDWLGKVVAEHGTPEHPIFLFMHHPPINWDGDGQEPVEHLYQQLFKTLEEYESVYIFSGNWHGYHREERNGIIFVVNGRGGDFDHDNQLTASHFSMVEVEDDQIEDIHIGLPPEVGILMRSTASDWLVAHIGELAVNNRLITSVVTSLATAACIGLILTGRIRLRSGTEAELSRLMKWHDPSTISSGSR